LTSYSLGAFALVAAAAAFPSAGHAVEFLLTSDHCSGGCIPAGGNAGTVTVTQNGANVDITVALAAGFSFVKTGVADFQNFKSNGVGVALGDITVDAHVPALVAATGAFNGDGTGNFTFGINCPSWGNGGSGAFSIPISFHVANATIADLTQPNNLGNVFVADVLAPNGNTGPVDVTAAPVPGPIVGAGLPGLVMGCGGIFALARRRRQKIV
jgi:hypothetical protein